MVPGPNRNINIKINSGIPTAKSKISTAKEECTPFSERLLDKNIFSN